jgi:hypothetical protein
MSGFENVVVVQKELEYTRELLNAAEKGYGLVTEQRAGDTS